MSLNAMPPMCYPSSSCILPRYLFFFRKTNLCLISNSLFNVIWVSSSHICSCSSSLMNYYIRLSHNELYKRIWSKNKQRTNTVSNNKMKIKFVFFIQMKTIKHHLVANSKIMLSKWNLPIQ